MNKDFLDKIYLSIETSGLTPIDFKIIEIAVLKIDEFNNKSLFHKLINPQKELGEEVTKLTLISNEDLKNQKNFDQIKDQLLSFLGKTKIIAAPHSVRHGAQEPIVIAPTQIAKASHAKTAIIVHPLNVKQLPVGTRITVVNQS